MELLQLRYFCESAENENLSHTALHHLVAPSAVSLSVKRLENELGCELFIREGNRIRLNEKGKIFSIRVKKALEILDSAVDELHNASGKIAGDIYILVRTDRSIINAAVSEFAKKYPYAAFHISHDFEKEISARYDLIIDESSVSYPGYLSEPFITEALRFAASKDSPFSKGIITLKELSKEKFVTLSKSSSLGRITLEACRNVGFEPDIAVECDDPHLLRSYAACGIGIILIPEKSWGKEMDERLSFLTVADFSKKRKSSIFIKPENSKKAVLAFKEFLNCYKIF